MTMISALNPAHVQLPLAKAAPGRQALPTTGVDTVELRFAASPVKPRKVSIIGAGNVGESLAHDLAQKEVAQEIAFVDMMGDKAKAKALDLQQACAVWGSDTKAVGGNDYDIIKDSDIVVVTAGSARKPGQSRDDMLEAATKVIASVSKKIAEKAPNATIIMVSNPLDAMCHVAQQVTGFPPERVIGMAGVLDSARFKTFLADELKTSVSDIHATVLGGHGDTMVPLTRYTTVNGVSVEKRITPQRLREIIDRTRNGGGEIVGLLGTSGYKAPGAAVAKMIEAIFKGKSQVLPASVYLEGQYGVNGLYVGVPVKLGKDGIEEIVELDLTPEEKRLFDASVASVKQNADKIPAIMQRLNQAQNQ